MIFEPDVWLVQTICFHIPLERSLNILLISSQTETFGGPGGRVSRGFTKHLAVQTILCNLQFSEEKMLPISGHILRKSFQAAEMDH